MSKQVSHLVWIESHLPLKQVLSQTSSQIWSKEKMEAWIKSQVLSTQVLGRVSGVVKSNQTRRFEMSNQIVCLSKTFQVPFLVKSLFSSFNPNLLGGKSQVVIFVT